MIPYWFDIESAGSSGLLAKGLRCHTQLGAGSATRGRAGSMKGSAMSLCPMRAIRSWTESSSSTCVSSTLHHEQVCMANNMGVKHGLTLTGSLGGEVGAGSGATGAVARIDARSWWSSTLSRSWCERL